MLKKATLEGLAGVVDLQFRWCSSARGEWRGMFRADDERSIARLSGDRPAVLETTLEEERRRLSVTVTSTTDGLAVFQSDEPSVPTDGPSSVSATARAIH